MPSFTYIADDRHACLRAILASVPSRAGRAAVLRQSGLHQDKDLLDALDAAVATPCPLTGGVDLDRITIALADTGRVLPLRMAVAIIEDEARDRRIELARTS